MTMPIGSTEEPMAQMTERQSIPVHVVSSSAKSEKMYAPEFGQWRTFLINNVVQANSSTPGAQRIANRSLRRQRLLIKVSATVVPAAGAPTGAAGTISAAGAGSAALPAGATLTSIQVTFPTATTAAGTITITNTVGTNPVFNIPTGTTTFSASGNWGAASPSSAVTVTVAGAASASGGNLVITGTTVAVSQPASDGVILGSREFINTGLAMNPANGSFGGGLVLIGDSLRWESQQELWAAYPTTNASSVYVTVCDEVYASNPVRPDSES